jgi:hypothetical protein
MVLLKRCCSGQKTMRRGTLVWLIVALSWSGLSTTASAQIFDVSVSGIGIAPGERVAAFEVSLQAAKVYSVREFPEAWGISVDNPGNWYSSIKGGCEVGAAALDAGFFDRLLVVKKQHGPDDPNFDIEMRLYVTRDFDETRTIVLHAPDIKLLPR